MKSTWKYTGLGNIEDILKKNKLGRTVYVVEPKVRQVDSSSSILLSQDCFGIRDFLYFHTNCEIICSSSVKNAIGSLIGIALNL